MPSRAAISILLVIAAIVFLAGINWGLPAPASVTDPFLFADHPRWTGAQILALAGPTEDPNRGADVASHPSADRSGVAIVNSTDQERARIIRRYRLMSYQPDEWNTLKALAEMKPGQGNFDPKLYQYGGLWVYPVGAMLKIAAMLHLIDLRSDMAWYLDHPTEFGRFYVVARLYSAMWGLVGVYVVFALVHRISGDNRAATIAGFCFIFMPVVVNMAHEAKPHLAGAVLILLAVLAASKYVENGRHQDWLLAGAFCGAAVGMVLTSLPVFLVLPAMVLLRKSNWQKKAAICAAAVAIAVAVYVVSNPCVPINFVFHRALLESNLGNSRAMYHPQLTRAGISNAAYLIAAGCSPILALSGAIGAIALAIRAVRVRHEKNPAEIRRRATGLLLAVPSLCVLGQCVLVATGKPGEFGRFMLLPDLFLMLEAIVAIVSFPNSTVVRRLKEWELLLAISIAVPGLTYLYGFWMDTRSQTSRMVDASSVRVATRYGRKAMAIHADPAPYCLPPVDLFDGPIFLMPKDADSNGEQEVADEVVEVRLDNARLGVLGFWVQTPISWADKRFVIPVTIVAPSSLP